MYILEQLINGLSQGAIYALMAIGFTMIAGEVGLVSFTYGDTVMVGAFSAYLAAALFHENLILTVIFTLIISAIMSVLVHAICMAKFLEAPKHISMICTIGFGIITKNLVQLIAGYEVKSMPELLGRSFFSISGIRIGYVKIYIVAIVILLCIVLSILLHKTKTGIQLRAVSQDKKAAALLGINVHRITMLGNMIGCMLGGLGGLLYAIYYGSILPTMGGAISMKAMSASVLGGLSNIPVAAFAGVLLGIFENFSVALFPQGYRDLISFVFLIFVLIWKPHGIEFKFKKTYKEGKKP